MPLGVKRASQGLGFTPWVSVKTSMKTCVPGLSGLTCTNITMMVRKASPNHHQPLLVIYTQTIYPMNPNHVLFSEWIVRERDEKRLIRGYKFVNEFVQ